MRGTTPAARSRSMLILPAPIQVAISAGFDTHSPPLLRGNLSIQIDAKSVSHA
jgi:hypothetical protein